MKNTIYFILSIILAIFLPWVLIILFMILLTDASWIFGLEIPQMLAVISFQSFGFVYNIPLLGYGFGIPLLIWILVGIFCGITAKSPIKGLVATIIGLLANILIFEILNLISPITGFGIVDPLIAPIFGGSEMLITLLLYLFWYSCILPAGMFGGLTGGVISRFRNK
ncbi:MAG: hypothetical protein GF329_05460 [Candidatus Lokiarchaeota archaeon]|nr:hypothetical protein [Candidatus Lokiarchaeota archaeon]